MESHKYNVGNYEESKGRLKMQQVVITKNEAVYIINILETKYNVMLTIVDNMLYIKANYDNNDGVIKSIDLENLNPYDEGEG